MENLVAIKPREDKELDHRHLRHHGCRRLSNGIRTVEDLPPPRGGVRAIIPRLNRPTWKHLSSNVIKRRQCGVAEISWRNKQSPETEHEPEDPSLAGRVSAAKARAYQLSDIIDATDGFNPLRIIGQGSSKTVYTAVFPDDEDHLFTVCLQPGESSTYTIRWRRERSTTA
ncbi:unnamed protein product [Linum tenue]|uniref:Uncharacterized protein n=1 Tax=Linum tenue TaxID=586396 RepID=A0AAV0Q969_9ROSI|nr:unnamed protein product [Linum tenue]